MSEERFINLVEENNGFEFYQAYRDDVDYVIGGKGDTFWFVKMKNQKAVETYIGKYNNGTWEDSYIKGNGSPVSKPSGTAIKLITENAYLAQDEEWVKRRTPKPIEDSHPHYHYVYGFGDKAVDVSVQYGVTIGFSDIKNVGAGFRLRYLYTGEDVESV